MGKEELIAIRDELETILLKLNRLCDDKKITKEYEDWYVRRMNILSELLKKGGTLPTEEFHKLANKHGMDTRGLGGFFIKSNPSLTKFADSKGERIALTKKGMELAKKWLEEQ